MSHIEIPILDRWFEILFFAVLTLSSESEKRALTVFLGLACGCVAAAIILFEDHFWGCGRRKRQADRPAISWLSGRPAAKR